MDSFQKNAFVGFVDLRGFVRKGCVVLRKSLAGA
jgi:hypothetical protein